MIEKPRDMVLIGSSRKTSNQILLVKDRILSLQGHPELTLEIIKEMIRIKNLNEKAEGEKEADSTFIVNVILKFLTSTYIA